MHQQHHRRLNSVLSTLFEHLLSMADEISVDWRRRMLCRIGERHHQHHHSSICLKNQKRTEKLCLKARHSRHCLCPCGSLSSTAYRLILTSLLVPRQSRSTAEASATNLKSAEDRSCQQKGRHQHHQQENLLSSVPLKDTTTTTSTCFKEFNIQFHFAQLAAQVVYR